MIRIDACDWRADCDCGCDPVLGSVVFGSILEPSCVLHFGSRLAENCVSEGLFLRERNPYPDGPGITTRSVQLLPH